MSQIEEHSGSVTVWALTSDEAEAKAREAIAAYVGDRPYRFHLTAYGPNRSRDTRLWEVSASWFIVLPVPPAPPNRP